jgi:hypothetical protein
MVTRDEAWNALNHNFKSLMDCLGKLTEEELTSAPVEGIWTVKDIVAHVWSWDDEAIRTAREWTGPRTWQQGMIDNEDGWNEAQVTNRAALLLIPVVDGLTGAHRRLVHMLDTASDEALAQVAKAPWGEEMPLVDFFYEMAGHYTTHMAALQQYQEKCLNCD